MPSDNVTILPVTPDGATARGFGLRADLQAQACRRVAQFALLMAAIVAVVFLVSGPVWQDFTGASAIVIVRIMQASLVVLSIAVFLIARSQRFSTTVILYLGLLYEFLFCLIVSIGYNWFTGEAYGIFAAINISTVVIAVYPMIVPSPTIPTLLTSLASASTAPAGLFVVSRFGSAAVGPADYLGVSMYPALCVALAVFGSRIIYGLNREVASAREVGSYRLGEVIGTGGMGEVWRAEHRLLARPAAIKLVRAQRGEGSDGTDRQIQQRFEREAQVTASLESPHTVALFDFGLVALRREPEAGNSRLTVQGAVGGTPAYLAPELAQGQRFDGRADLYALGCVGYWLLMGRPVFGGDTPMAVILAHVRDRPAPPSAIAEVDVPPALDALILACLEKDPDRRPASADELRSRLVACTVDEPWSQERARNGGRSTVRSTPWWPDPPDTILPPS